MKQAIIKISSVVLALLVLFSTFSFTVEKHFCGDSLIDVSIIGNVEDCCGQKDALTVTKKKCCTDEVIQINGQDKLQHSSFGNFETKQQQFVAFFILSYQNVFIQKSRKQIYFDDFSPPDFQKDFQTLYQTFLI